MQVKPEQWEKMGILALQIAGAIDILDPSMRFDHDNHAPMLPPCLSCILDSFPKEVQCGAFKNGKYGYKTVKGSLVIDFRGNILDFQLHEYGNRHDPIIWPYHQNAMSWQPWEFALADMAYELCPNILTQYVMHGQEFTHTQMLYNSVLGFYRSRVEALVADIVRNKGLFSHPWSGDLALLKALMIVEVHAAQLYRNLFGPQRFVETSGNYAHRPFVQ